MHHRINIVSLNLVLTRSRTRTLPPPPPLPHLRVSVSQADGGYDFQVAKSTLKELPETLASTADGVPSALVEAMGVTIERLQEIVSIAATSILSLGPPRPTMPTMSLAVVACSCPTVAILGVPTRSLS